MPIAQVAGTRAAFEGSVEVDGARVRIEGVRRCRDRVAAEPRALSPHVSLSRPDARDDASLERTRPNAGPHAIGQDGGGQPREAEPVETEWVVRVPASSANVGPAFDAVAIALGTHLEVAPEGEEPSPESHPAVRAFRGAGGQGRLFVRSRFPGGRGLGFSAAARVGGLLAAHAQQGRTAREARTETLRAATELEGHADNAAAALYGGVVAVAGRHVVRVPLARELAIVVWVPEGETATASARRLLPEQVPFDDAVFNVGRTALLVAALAAGAVDAMRVATEDRLHQDRRLTRARDTRVAIDAMLGAGAFAAWLSGSGPSAAAFVDPADAEAVAAALPSVGRALVLDIDDEGAVIL